jgi:hypothetical protein
VAVGTGDASADDKEAIFKGLKNAIIQLLISEGILEVKEE